MRMAQQRISVRSGSWIHCSQIRWLSTQQMALAKARAGQLPQANRMPTRQNALVRSCSNLTRFLQGKCHQPLRQFWGGRGHLRRHYGTRALLPWACPSRIIIRYMRKSFCECLYVWIYEWLIVLVFIYFLSCWKLCSSVFKVIFLELFPYLRW